MRRMTATRHTVNLDSRKKSRTLKKRWPVREKVTPTRIRKTLDLPMKVRTLQTKKSATQITLNPKEWVRTRRKTQA